MSNCDSSSLRHVKTSFEFSTQGHSLRSKLLDPDHRLKAIGVGSVAEPTTHVVASQNSKLVAHLYILLLDKFHKIYRDGIVLKDPNPLYLRQKLRPDTAMEIWETFEWPTGEAGLMMMVSIIANASKFALLLRQAEAETNQ